MWSLGQIRMLPDSELAFLIGLPKVLLLKMGMGMRQAEFVSRLAQQVRNSNGVINPAIVSDIRTSVNEDSLGGPIVGAQTSSLLYRAFLFGIRYPKRVPISLELRIPFSIEELLVNESECYGYLDLFTKYTKLEYELFNPTENGRNFILWAKTISSGKLQKLIPSMSIVEDLRSSTIRPTSGAIIRPPKEYLSILRETPFKGALEDGGFDITRYYNTPLLTEETLEQVLHDYSAHRPLRSSGGDRGIISSFIGAGISIISHADASVRLTLPNSIFAHRNNFRYTGVAQCSTVSVVNRVSRPAIVRMDSESVNTPLDLRVAEGSRHGEIFRHLRSDSFLPGTLADAIAATMAIPIPGIGRQSINSLFNVDNSSDIILEEAIEYPSTPSSSQPTSRSRGNGAPHSLLSNSYSENDLNSKLGGCLVKTIDNDIFTIDRVRLLSGGTQAELDLNLLLPNGSYASSIRRAFNTDIELLTPVLGYVDATITRRDMSIQTAILVSRPHLRDSSTRYKIGFHHQSVSYIIISAASIDIASNRSNKSMVSPYEGFGQTSRSAAYSLFNRKLNTFEDALAIVDSGARLSMSVDKFFALAYDIPSDKLLLMYKEWVIGEVIEGKITLYDNSFLIQMKHAGIPLEGV